MTDTMTFQNIDLSYWDTLYMYIYIYMYVYNNKNTIILLIINRINFTI